MSFLKMKYCIVFFVLLLSLSTIAQEHKLQLKTPEGEPIGYLTVLCEKRHFCVLSDARGWVSLDSKYFQAGDTLCFTSMFYHELKVPYVDLLGKQELVLRPVVMKMDEVVVYPASAAEEMVREMAESFSQRYAENYAASLTYLRTVECNDRYREFYGLQGLYFSIDFNQTGRKLFFMDKHLLTCLPVTVMRSNSLAEDSDKVLSRSSVILPPGSISRFSVESMNVEYQTYPKQTALSRKRTLEIYSPLNPKQLKNFTYAISDSYKRGNEKIYVIFFETKDGAFSSRTKVYGKGMLYYNLTTRMVEKIVMENHQDQYAMFPRWKVDRMIPSATRHILEVAYVCKDDRIFTKSVKMDVEWVDPKVEYDFYFFIENARRKPFENHLKQYDYYEFDNFIVFDNHKKKQIVPYLCYHSWEEFFYLAPFDPEAWEKVKWTGINKKRLFSELSLPGCSLYQQAEKNALDVKFYYRDCEQWFYDRISNLYRRVPAIYKILQEK